MHPIGLQVQQRPTSKGAVVREHVAEIRRTTRLPTYVCRMCSTIISLLRNCMLVSMASEMLCGT